MDEVAAGSAFELVRRIEVLVEHTDHTPLRLRQDGGLAQREARVVGVAARPAGGHRRHPRPDRAGGRPARRRTARTHRDAASHRRVRRVAGVVADRAVGLGRLAAGARHIRRAAAPGSRRCASARSGSPREARVLGPDEIRSWLSWHVPRLVDDATRRATTMLGQASWIGVTGLGALSSFGRGDELTALERLLPAARRHRARPERPHGHRRRPADRACGARARGTRRRRVARRRHCLPVHRRVPAPRPRPRLVLGGDDGGPEGPVPYAHPPAARLPDRRPGPHRAE